MRAEPCHRARAPAVAEPGMPKWSLITLKRRADFLRVKGGRRWRTPGFTIEMRPFADDAAARAARLETKAAEAGQGRAGVEPEAARFGFTTTKKLGSAVVRNRIRRRLKALVREVAPGHARPGCDYVIIAHAEAANRSFAAMREELRVAFERLHEQKGPQRSRGGKGLTATK